MTQRFVICDHGTLDANVIPQQLLGRPGYCPFGVYETWLLKNGISVNWDDHWGRLLAGVQHLGLNSGHLSNILTPALATQLAIGNGFENLECRLRVQVFQRRQLIESASITLIAAVFPVDRVSPSEFSAAISQRKRSPQEFSYNYKLMGNLETERELDRARASGYADVIFVNHQNEVCEAAYANVWLVHDDILYTPPINSPCLPGVTRKQVFYAAKKLGLQVVESRPVPVDMLHAAEEIFLTSTVRGIQPVNRIGETKVGSRSGGTESRAALLVKSIATN